MYENPQDMFREMDELFAHLYDRMARDFTATGQQAPGFPMLIRQGNDHSQLLDYPDNCVRARSEPVAEVHHSGDEVKVITELPGVTMEDINITICDQELSLDADGGNVQYHTHAALPPVDPGSIRTSLKNGVLEVSLKIIPGDP